MTNRARLGCASRPSWLGRPLLKHLGASVLGEGGEHVADRGGGFFVGIDDGVAVIVADEPDGQRDPQLAAPRGGPLGLVQAAGQPVQRSLLCRPARYAEQTSRSWSVLGGSHKFIGIIPPGLWLVLNVLPWWRARLLFRVHRLTGRESMMAKA